MRTDQQRLFLLKIAAAGIIGLLVLDQIVIEPIMKGWGAQTERLTKLKEQVKKGDELLAREKTLRDRWADMMHANLPKDQSLAENAAYNAVIKWATDSQIVFTNFTPAPWKSGDVGSKTWNCRISANGDQATIARFLYDLETDAIPVSLDECEITTRDARGSQLLLTAHFSFLQLPEEKKNR